MDRRWITNLNNVPANVSRRSPHDVVAPTVVAHPVIGLQRSVGNAQVVRMLAQRQDGEEEDELIQPRRAEATPAEVGMEGGPVSAEISGRIASHRGGGAPLADGHRQAMEAAFGASFADVRVHTGAEAEDLNRSISAHAFTTGSDIFFGRGASPTDQSLLAHELTHVVQQRDASASGPMTVTPAGNADEQEAEAVSAAVTSALSRG